MTRPSVSSPRVHDLPRGRRGFCVLAAFILLLGSCSEPNPSSDADPVPEQPASSSTTEDSAPEDPLPADGPVTSDDPVPDDSAQWHVALSVEGSTLVMEGSVEIGFAELFLDKVRAHQGEITTLRVNSPGGVTYEGIRVGHWIFDNEINVEVDGLCFSSCANYLFTAGRNKTILADSIVGWHGSEQQDEHVARGLGIDVEEVLGLEYDQSSAEELGETPTPEGRRRFIEEVLSTSITAEKEFLDKVGVSADALLYGLLEGQFQDYYHASNDIDGWTFSIADMAKFGIGNVKYAGEGDYPSKQALESYGVTVFAVP